MGPLAWVALALWLQCGALAFLDWERAALAALCAPIGTFILWALVEGPPRDPTRPG